MTKIVLTKWNTFGASHNGKKGGRVYIDKERILEVHEAEDKSHCTIIVKGSKEHEFYEIAETFDEVRAVMEFEPEVADIFIKGKELS